MKQNSHKPKLGRLVTGISKKEFFHFYSNYRTQKFEIDGKK